MFDEVLPPGAAAPAYQVLARKWRPKSFASLVGQEHVVKALGHALDQQRLHHAYLFTGTRGVGKTTIARIMAKALNCETGVSSTPCGECASCREIDSGRFVDYIELDAASNRGVEDMTQLLERATYAPTRGRYKVYVIDEVHQLSGHAFNAMLKTLEEPPEHVKFILATTDPQKIPVTVLSRCLQFNLKQMPPAQIIEHLARVLQAEGVAFDAAALRPLAKGAAGSMRDALSLLDQAIAHGAGEVREEAVLAMLGTVSQDHLLALLDALVASDADALVAVARMMEARSLSFDTALQDLATLLHRIALAQFAPQAITDAAERAVLATYAAVFDAEFVQLAYQICVHGRNELELAPDDYAGFVMSLLRLHAFSPARAAARGSAGGAGPGGPQSQRPSPAPAMAPKAAAQRATEAPNARSAVPPKVSLSTPAASNEPTDGPGGPASHPLPDTDSDTIQAMCATDWPAWPALAARLPMGMARQLAQHCAWAGRDGNRIRLRLSPAHKHLLGKAREDKLQSELQAQFGSAVRLHIEQAEPASETPAQRTRAQQQARQDAAEAAIAADPLVIAAREQLGATVDAASVRPV